VIRLIELSKSLDRPWSNIKMWLILPPLNIHVPYLRRVRVKIGFKVSVRVGMRIFYFYLPLGLRPGQLQSTIGLCSSLNQG